MEVWKVIDGFDGLYEISSLGRLRNTKTGYIKKSFNKDGYRKFNLCKNSKNFNKYAHRLVAEAFILNPENKPQVNHKNGVKDDNRLENLEWCTGSENVRHSLYVLGNGLFRKFTSDEKELIFKEYNPFVKGSLKSLSLKLGLSVDVLRYRLRIDGIYQDLVKKHKESKTTGVTFCKSRNKYRSFVRKKDGKYTTICSKNTYDEAKKFLDRYKEENKDLIW